MVVKKKQKKTNPIAAADYSSGFDVSCRKSNDTGNDDSLGQISNLQCSRHILVSVRIDWNLNQGGGTKKKKSVHSRKPPKSELYRAAQYSGETPKVNKLQKSQYDIWNIIKIHYKIERAK